MYNLFMKPFTKLTKEQKTRTCQSCGKEYVKGSRRSNKWFLNSKYCGNKCYYSDPNYQSKRSDSISKARKGWVYTEETKRKISEVKKGKPLLHFIGEKNPNWNGGITPENHKIRNSLEYKNWRRMVFERDNYTCLNCNIRGGNLNADHIKPFTKYPELRFDLNNGRTLCVPCHKKIGWNPYKEKWGNAVTNASPDCPLIP